MPDDPTTPALLADQLDTIAKQVAAIPDPPPTWPFHPGVVIGPDQLATVGPGPALDKILTSGSSQTTPQRPTQRYSSKTYKPWLPGTTLDTAELPMFRDDSVAAKIQALLWQATSEQTYLDNAVAILDAYGAVTAFAPDPAESRRLNAAWACDNLTQTLSIIGYGPGPFERLLTEACWPLLDWPTGVNWHASFAASRLGIAAVTSRDDLWAQAVDYFEQRIAQGIYHRGWDGPIVRPLRSAPETVTHWYGQITSTLVAASSLGVKLPDGSTGEYARDLSHTMMGLDGFVHAALTMRHQGGHLPQHVLDRLTAAYELIGKVVLKVVDGGQSPVPIGSPTDYKMGWLPALTLLGPTALPTVAQLVTRPVIANPGAGANHMVAEALTDGAVS